MRFFLKSAMLAMGFLVFVTPPLMAQATDIQGSEDHPLFTRYPGSIIHAYDFKEYDEFVLPLAPLEGGIVNAALTEYLEIEGRVTRIQYRTENRSTLEVFRNYQSAVTNAGFDILFEKQGRNSQDVHRFVAAYYDSFSSSRAMSSGNPSFVGSAFRYLAARMPQPDGDIYVSIYVTTRGNRTTTQLDIIETVPMEADMIKIDADYLMSELERTGFVALDGLYFETNEADMTPESKPALDEIALLLRDHPELNFYIVGHTDNTGDHSYNMNLSQKRAESVARELHETHGISPARLYAIGVGPVSPVATNSTTAGRTLNRRVELVIR